MKNNKYVLSSLIILFTGVFYFTLHAQQKNDTHRANFSGK
jgi:preprotein translocase subunit YajC